MRDVHLTFAELGLLAGTRTALGAGLGLLLADHLSVEQRRAVGWTLVAIGVVSTIPLATEVLGGLLTSSHDERQELATSGHRF